MSLLNGLFGTPPKASGAPNNLTRSPSSPFCTSPSQLEELTLDDDATLSSTMGIRSPSGPMRGRSVKEFEEQLTNLKKENFNLKLRIYFLEEKMGTNFTLDKDNVVKQNVELKIEIANLQKEAKEKHELLCQAVRAMELEEDEHRKEAQSKDEQLAQLQQELEDVRTQLQDIRFLSNVESAKSGVSSRQLENIDNYENEFVPEVDLKGRYSEDGESVKNHSQLANFAFDKTETFRLQIGALQKECQLKDETINSLNAELTSANQRLIDFAQQIKEYEEKLAQAHMKTENLMATIQEKQHTVEKLCSQLTSLNQKYSVVKYELEQERREFERDRKSLERNKIMSDMRGDALEHESRKNREVIKELQAKLEGAITEAKKNQNLAVSKSRQDNQTNSHTDSNSILVSDAATPDGTPKKDSLHVPIKAGHSSKVQTPEGKHLVTFEKLLTEREDSRILNEFTIVKNEFNAQKQKIVKLKSEQLKACEIIKIMIDTRNKANEEITQLKKAKEDLEKQLENVVSKPQQEYDNVPLVTKVSDLKITAVGTPPVNEKHDMDDALQQTVDMEIVEQYKRLALELEAKIEVLVATLKEKDSQMQYIRGQYDKILNILAEKEDKIVDLEFELLSTNQNSGNVDRSLLEKGDTGSEKHSSFYKQELEEKDKEIEKLNVELKKCTCYLQEIVNKELWDKNREIEKMHLKQESTAEVIKLRKELSEKDMQLKLLKEKISELGLDLKFPIGEAGDPYSPKKNIEHIKALQDQIKIAKKEKTSLEQRIIEFDHLQATVVNIQAENNNIKEELAKSERLRVEAAEVCSVLSTRLEELAIFLDSLLKQKSVLGFLGLAKNKRLREIINNSLDMSRSFTMSLMANPEQSLAQLSNITSLLNGSVFQDLSLADENGAEEETHLSIVPDSIILTYESHLYKKTNDDQPEKERVIAALRDQIVNLKSELKLRDNELNKLNGNKESGVEKLTEETEEDKGVSKLFTPKSTSATLKAGQCEGQSESEAWSEPDRAVSRARIGLNNSVPAAFKPTKLHYNESTEDDDLYHTMTPSKRRSTIMELTQDICRLEKELEEKSEQVVVNNRLYRQKLQDLDKELRECKEKLLQANTEKSNAFTKVEDLQKVVNKLSLSKQQYEEGMLEKNKETQDKINQLEQEKQKVIEQSQNYERQAINAKNEAKQAEEQLKALQLNMNQLEETVRKQYEETLIEKLKHAEDVFTRRVKSVEEKCEAELRITQENIKLVEEEYSREYIKKSDVQNKLVKVEKLMHELEDLKTTVQSYEESISSYKDKEKEINRVVQEYENQIHTLKSELENTTLQYSEAVLEKTRLYNEKQVLEQQIGHISHKEEELRAQLQDIQVKLSEVSQKYDQQLLSVQKQKSNLELKLSELESSNADLHNRLIKAQSVKFGVGLNATMPASLRSSRTVYRRQCSDQNTVSSEENLEELRSCGFNRSQVNPAVHPSAEAERAASNSSPDLGIESDHGRFSSLETNVNNLSRPLLETIELTASMNDLFEAQNPDAETNTSNTDHCCQKSLDIARENNELKRKLLRMKRALEETATQLNLANQRKKQVEKTICKQIHKTSQVLRKAKANLDSGSESDVFRM